MDKQKKLKGRSTTKHQFTKRRKEEGGRRKEYYTFSNFHFVVVWYDEEKCYEKKIDREGKGKLTAIIMRCLVGI